MQEHVVRLVEPCDALVECFDIRDFVFFQSYLVRDIVGVRVFVVLDLDIARAPLDQSDMHDARMDGLRRQIGAAGDIAVFPVPRVEFFNNGVEILDGNFLPDMRRDDSLPHVRRHNRRFVHFHAL